MILLTTQQIKNELKERGVILYHLVKNGSYGFIATYAIRLNENTVSTQKEIWVEEKIDLLDTFPTFTDPSEYQ